MDVDQDANSRVEGGKRYAAFGACPDDAGTPRRVSELTCVPDTWHSCLYQIGAAPSAVSQEGR